MQRLRLSGITDRRQASLHIFEDRAIIILKGGTGGKSDSFELPIKPLPKDCQSFFPTGSPMSSGDRSG
jgi:hypothetical protein